MGIFSRKPRTEPIIDPADRDFMGDDIWRIIAAGLDNYGMILRRGTGEFGLNKWGDGKYHLKCQVDPKPEPVLEMVTDDGEIIKVSDWNALTQEQRKDFVRTRGARFRVIEGDAEQSEGVNL